MSAQAPWEETKKAAAVAFRANDVAKALELYMAAAAAADPPPAEETAKIHCNASLCALKLKKLDLCVSEATLALESEAMRPKALYRRARALFLKNDLLPAVVDAKRLLEMRPDNSDAQKLLVMLRDAASRTESGIVKAFADAESEENEEKRESELKRILGGIAEDEARAKELCSIPTLTESLLRMADVHDVCYAILSRLADFDATKHVVVSSSKVLSKLMEKSQKILDADSASQRRSKLYDTAPLLALARILFTRCEATLKKHESNEEKRRKKEKKEFDEETALWREMKEARQEHDPALPPRPTFKYKAKTAPRCVSDDELRIFARAIRDPLRSGLREVGVEAISRICDRYSEHARVLVTSDELEGLKAVGELAARDAQLASVVLGRVLPSISDDDLILEKVYEMCLPCLSSDSSKGGIDPEATQTPEQMEKVRAALSALVSVFLANANLGMEVVQKPNCLNVLLSRAQLAVDEIVSLVAEVFAQLASVEKGRFLLQEHARPTLERLLHSDNAKVRASSSVALTKLSAVAFDPESDQGNIVMGAVATLLSPEKSVEERRRGIEAVSFVATDTDVKDMISLGSGSEVLKALISLIISKDHPLKDGEVAYGLAFIFENLTMDEDDKKREKLREMEVSQQQWEQFEKITKQKSTPHNGRKDSPEAVAARVDAFVEAGGVVALRKLAESDSANVLACVAACMRNVCASERVRGKVISQGGISGLLRVATLSREAKERQVSQGHDERSAGASVMKTSKDSAHALAKLLITTDPRLVPDSSLYDCVQPLLQQIRTCDEDLVVFECLMALTNLATISDEMKGRICDSKGLAVLEYAQFNDNLMIRRAATECASNLVWCQQLEDWLCIPSKCRLWVLLAEDFEQDMETSRAAMGCLAGMAYDPKVREVIRCGVVEEQNLKKKVDGVRRICETVCECPYEEIVHRGVVALSALYESDSKTEEEAKMIRAAMASCAERGGDQSSAIAQAFLKSVVVGGGGGGVSSA